MSILPNSPARASFFSRVTSHAVLFILLLSLAVNVFFVATSAPVSEDGPKQSRSSAVSSSVSSLPALAFGTVARAVPIRTQQTDASGALLKGVKNYVLPASLLPVLPSELPVYRDQGVPLDAESVRRLFETMHVPLDPVTLQLLPDTYSFKAADNSLRISVALPSRTLTVTRVVPPQVIPNAERADDSEVMALAKTFAESLRIDLSSFAPPRIYETPATQTQPKRTYVTWPLAINGIPVIAQDGSPVPALTMQIGRIAHRALSATLSLLLPDVLAVSKYPVLKKESIEARLQSGGLLPLPKDPKGETVTYASAGIVYLLIPQDDQSPTYLIPAMRATFIAGGKSLSTFVPMLDRKSFDWKEQGTVSSVSSVKQKN